MFKPNRKFRRDYDRMFKKDPQAANMLLMLCELANENGEVVMDGPCPEEEIARLMSVRFPNPRRYSL
ncbi:MAG: hypothetical protein HPY65_17940 [Syntrophaceae bacterium]|nr:hypothetical protein [Syntrophaceae bacterium]